MLYPCLVVRDALGAIQGRSVGSLPFPLADLALATARCLPIDLENQPATFLTDRDHLEPWSTKSQGNRAIIWLHTLYDRAQLGRRQKVSYLDLMLRTLEYSSGVHVTFRMQGEQVAEIVTYFGREDRSGFSVTAVPFGGYDIAANSFVPVSDTCET